MVCFYCTQSDILLCSIASFSRGNKNKLRTFQPQKGKKIKNSQPQTKFTGSYKKKSVVCFYSTQSDILLCGIARFSRGNKNKLRTFQPQK